MFWCAVSCPIIKFISNRNIFHYYQIYYIVNLFKIFKFIATKSCKLNGKTLIEYAIESLVKNNIEKYEIIFNTVPYTILDDVELDKLNKDYILLNQNKNIIKRIKTEIIDIITIVLIR